MPPSLLYLLLLDRSGTFHHPHCTAACISLPTGWYQVFLVQQHGSHYYFDQEGQSEAIDWNYYCQPTKILLNLRLRYISVFLAWRHEHCPVGKKNSIGLLLLCHFLCREVLDILKVLRKKTLICRRSWYMIKFYCYVNSHQDARPCKPLSILNNGTKSIA